jgi:hypothetical protein
MARGSDSGKQAWASALRRMNSTHSRSPARDAGMDEASSGGAIERFAAIVGVGNVVSAEAEMRPYLTEWRGYYRGRSPAILKPG